MGCRPEYRSLVQPVGLGRWLVGPLPRRARPGVLDAACLAFHCIGARLQGRAPKWFLVALNLMCGCGLASLFSLSSPSCVASLWFLCCPLLVLPSSSLSLPPSVSLVASPPSPLSPLLPRLRGSSGELFKTALWVMIVPEKRYRLTGLRRYKNPVSRDPTFWVQEVRFGGLNNK